MLIDVQIENTKVKEEFETRTFEFTNQVIIMSATEL